MKKRGVEPLEGMEADAVAREIAKGLGYRSPEAAAKAAGVEPREAVLETMFDVLRAVSGNYYFDPAGPFVLEPRKITLSHAFMRGPGWDETVAGATAGVPPGGGSIFFERKWGSGGGASALVFVYAPDGCGDLPGWVAIPEALLKWRSPDTWLWIRPVAPMIRDMALDLGWDVPSAKED